MTSGFRFEILGRRHLEWLKNLRNQNKEWFMDSQQVDIEETETWFRNSSNAGDLNLVIKNEEERIGFISVYNIFGGVANIGRMMIEDKYKHQGYMERAMIHVFDICRNQLKLDELTLEVKASNIIARDFYSKMGFIVRGFTADTYIMRKAI